MSGHKVSLIGDGGHVFATKDFVPGQPVTFTIAENDASTAEWECWVVYSWYDGLRVEALYDNELSALRAVNEDGTYSLRARRVRSGDPIQDALR